MTGINQSGMSLCPFAEENQQNVGLYIELQRP